MTLAIGLGRKARKQTNKSYLCVFGSQNQKNYQDVLCSAKMLVFYANEQFYDRTVYG